MKPSDLVEATLPATSGKAVSRRARAKPTRLFATLLGNRAEASFDTRTAIMIPLVGAMLADGRVEEEELFEIDAICAFSPIFERNSSHENELLIIHATRLIEDHGLQKMCERAAALLSPALRETAFVYAVKVIFSDGRYGAIEQAVVADLTEWLGIPADRAATMIDIISVMRRPEGA